MNAKRSFPIPGDPQFEPLEPRLLLSADPLLETAPLAEALALPPGTVVSPAVEDESNGGPANDDLAGAQELAFSYLLPWMSPDDGFGPQQAAVTGTADGTGGADYDQYHLFFAVVAYPRAFGVGFTGAVAPAGDGVLTLSAKADLGGTSKYLTLEAEGIHLGDLFVDDGLSGVKVTTEVALAQDQLAALAADGMILFTLRPSPDVMNIGTGYVRMQVTYPGGGAGTGDYYSFDLAAGESASLAVTAAMPGQIDLELFDSGGTLLATGAPGSGQVDAAIAGFSADQAGTFYARVGGNGDYALAVNRNATMDLGDNDGIASAQQIESALVNGRQWALGDVGGDTDFYAVSVGPRGMLKLQAYAPGGKGGRNGLEPVIRLYDAEGNLVAGGEGSSLRYRAPRGGDGVYYVQVAAADGTGGEYVLSVKSQPVSPRAGLRGQRGGDGRAARSGRSRASRGADDLGGLPLAPVV